MNAADRIRDVAIREIGCIACRKEGHGFIPAEKHHLLTTGLHGNGERRGEQFTIGLCPWHHRGIKTQGATGPSLYHNPRAFRDCYGDDETLLAEQNRLIAHWRSTFVGGLPA